MNKGSIEIVCGPMFSGKTEELLRKLNRLHFAKTDFLLFKPSIDTRYNEDKQNDQKVVSHSQNSMSANIVESAIDILKQCEVKPHIKHVGIDEIQFLPSEDIFNAVKLCIELKKKGYRVIASGLDMDYKGQPFGLMGDLLAIADRVEKLKAVCFECGEDAGMSAKTTESLDLIEVGATEKYQSLCYHHWLKFQKKESL